MKKRFRSFFVFFCFFAAFLMSIPNVIPKEKTIIKKGDFFPKIPLNAPIESEHLMYLGINKGESFTIRDIKADLILVEIMNINCSSCQRQAPLNNKIYSLIESTTETRGRIKMFAVAVGGLNEYIKQFMEHFNTPYPVIQDPEFILYDAVGKCPIPLAVFIRKDPETGAGIVVGTHSGFDSDYKGTFQEIQRLMHVDLAVVREEGEKIQPKVVEVEPVITEAELQDKIRAAFADEGDNISNFKKIRLQSGRTVYSSMVRHNGQEKYLFAVMVSRPSPCDVCHDVHFIYIFETTGKVLQLIPVQLTKYGNDHWTDTDVDKMRKRLIGRYIYLPFDFDPGIDAVTSATITSSIIFKSLEEEQGVFRELRERGLLHIK